MKPITQDTYPFQTRMVSSRPNDQKVKQRYIRKLNCKETNNETRAKSEKQTLTSLQYSNQFFFKG